MDDDPTPDAPRPTFSVVICTYNRAPLLPRALESVLDQTFGDFEVVVVDDGSTDDTRAVVTAHADRRVRYVHQENQGLGAARNTGAASSSGRYVGFLDDDDFARPTWLERLASLVVGDPAVVCCGEVEADDAGQVQATYLPQQLGPVFCDYEGMFLAGTFFVRRELFDAVGGFRAGLQHLQQTEFALRLLPYCRAHGYEVRSVPEALVQLHAGGPRRTGPENTRALRSAMEIVLECHGTQLARSSWILAQYWTVAGVAAARTGDYRAARRCIAHAVRVRPREWKHWARLALASCPPVGKLVWDRERLETPTVTGR